MLMSVLLIIGQNEPIVTAAPSNSFLSTRAWIEEEVFALP